MKKPSAQKGFTLLELLIVMAIMAILAIMAINAYAGVQRGARIGYAADSLVASIREAQTLARSGAREGGATGVLQCFAVKLKDNKLETARTSYLPGTDSCETAAGWLPNDFFDENTVLKSLSAPYDSGLELYYKPPFGQVYRYDGSGFLPLVSGKIDMTVGAPDRPDFDLDIVYDLATGAVSRVNK